jgi:hypothetical protein
MVGRRGFLRIGTTGANAARHRRETACGASSARIELVSPGQLPAQWGQRPSTARASVTRDRQPGQWPQQVASGSVTRPLASHVPQLVCSAVRRLLTGAVEKISDFWAQGARTLSNQWLPGLPQVDLVPAVERYFEFVQRTVDISRDFTIKFAEAGNKLSGVARERVESAGDLVREQAESARDLVHEQAGKAEQAARNQAEQAEQAQRELAREARKAERDQARQAHEKARERYEGKTKAELSDLLDRRNLPKTGTVDELIERLVEADGK